MIAYTKCVACDGYGTRPSRKTPGRFVRCKACDRKGVLTVFTLGPPTVPLPTVPALPPSWREPLVPTTPEPGHPDLDPFEPLPALPQITCTGWPLGSRVVFGGPEEPSAEVRFK